MAINKLLNKRGKRRNDVNRKSPFGQFHSNKLQWAGW